MLRLIKRTAKTVARLPFAVLWDATKAEQINILRAYLRGERG